MAESERPFDHVIHGAPDVAAPRDPVYYYECSGGDFRLVYFMPPDELRRLKQRGELSQELAGMQTESSFQTVRGSLRRR